MMSLLALLLGVVTTSQALVTLSPQTRDRVSIRGQPQTVSIYGRRGGQPIVVTSGDGGWIHLGPRVAQRVIDSAREPKRLWIVEASDHRFSDNMPELERRLLEAIAWVTSKSPH